MCLLHCVGHITYHIIWLYLAINFFMHLWRVFYIIYVMLFLYLSMQPRSGVFSSEGVMASAGSTSRAGRPYSHSRPSAAGKSRPIPRGGQQRVSSSNARAGKWQDVLSREGCTTLRPHESRALVLSCHEGRNSWEVSFGPGRCSWRKQAHVPFSGLARKGHKHPVSDREVLELESCWGPAAVPCSIVRATTVSL